MSETFETFELPAGWEWCAVGDLITSITDGPFGSNLKTADYVGDGIRVIRLGNIGVGEFNDRDRSFITLEKYQGLLKHTAVAGDIVLAALAEPVGRACIVPRHIGSAIVKADCIRMRVDPQTSTELLTRWFNSPQGLRSAALSSHGIGRLRINLGEVRALPVPMPPYDEQGRIVSKLDAIFEQTRAAKARLERLPELLDKLKRSILAAAFRGDLTKDWRETHSDVLPAAARLDQLRNSRRARWENDPRRKGKDPSKETYETYSPRELDQLPGLPCGWAWAGLSEVSELQLGQRRAPEYRDETEYPYVRAANITWRGLDLSDVKTMGFVDVERLFLRRGDVVLSEASGSPTEVGKPGLWADEIPNCCFQATVLRLRPDTPTLSGEWLYLSCLADALLGRFAAMAPGIGILHLTAERMRNWPVPIAPLEEQSVLVARLKSALSHIYALEDGAKSHTKRVADFEQAALAKAFRGELVPQDPNDEPASVLLERIRSSRASAAESRSEPRKHRGETPRVSRARSTPSRRA